MERSPDSAKVHHNLGMVMLNQQRWKEAAEAFEKAIALNPQFADAHSNLGYVLAVLGNLSKAISSYEAAISHQPESPRDHLNLSTILNQAGQSRQALQPLRKAFDLAPSPAICVRLIRAHVQVGERSEALRFLEEGLERWPDDPELGGLGEALGLKQPR